jgi:hypothetical protein
MMSNSTQISFYRTLSLKMCLRKKKKNYCLNRIVKMGK